MAASGRRRAWNTPPLHLPSRCAASSPRLYRPTKELTVDFHPESKYFVQSIEYKSEITPLVRALAVRPVPASWCTFVAAAGAAPASRFLHLYLVYIAVIVLILLLAECVARWILRPSANLP